MVKDIDPGANSSYPSYMINVNNELYFTANDGSHGYELWKSDGPPPEPSWSRTSTPAPAVRRRSIWRP